VRDHRLRGIVSILLLTVWLPAQSPWALSVAVLAHAAHRVSLEWSQNHLHVVLHHDGVLQDGEPSPAAVHRQEADAATWSVPSHREHDVAAKRPAHDGDHVLHPFAADDVLKRTAQVGSFKDVAQAAVVAWLSPLLIRQPAALILATSSPLSRSVPSSRRTIVLLV